MKYADIAAAVATCKTVNIKGNEYVPVTERIKAFRMVEPEGSITTEILSMQDDMVVIRATVCTGDGKVLGTGTAFENRGSSYINKTSYIENCETSAVGRALGMAAFGVDESMASAEELANALLQQQDIQKAEAKGKPAPRTATVKAETPAEPIICKDCNKPLAPFGTMDVVQLAHYTKVKYGVVLCADCAKKKAKEQEAT